jgi:monofunctional glycosyltransferase
MHRRMMSWVVRLVGFIIVLFTLFWGSIYYYFTNVYNISDKIRQNVAARVALEHNHFLNYDQIPSMYVAAVVATEDRSFFSNIGIDPIGIGRSVYVDVQKKKYAQGGSTITQQLVHNALLSDYQKTFRWKLIEMVYAIGLYNTMTKNEIFSQYANDIYFGEGAYGLYDASETYFGKSPAELNDGELTMLAGIPNAPNAYDPFHSFTLAKERQKVVLLNMVDSGKVTQSQANKILEEPIRLKE